MKSLQISMLRGWRLFFLLYVALMMLSFSYERFSAVESTPVIELKSKADFSEAILFLPDLEKTSLGAKKLIGQLSKNHQIINIDYSKLVFKNSNYSVENYAQIIVEKLSEQEYFPVIIFSEGFGTVIAAEIIAKAPQLASSLILYNPKGIQDLELLGGYQLNKSVYSVFSIFSWTLENLVPDFGFFNQTRVSYQISRTRLDTDLRESKMAVKRILIPTLIVNNTQPNSSLSSSKEFNRLITNSTLINSVSGLEELQLIENFIEQKSEFNSSISVAREVKSLLPFSSSNVISAQGWLLMGLMLLIIFSTFVSEDLACIGAGLLAARGFIGFFPAVAASFIGIFVGDILIYASGRWLGKSATTKVPFKWFIDENDIKRSNQWFQAKGPTIILISRFIPGTRFPTYFTAGIIGASFWMFIAYFGIASLIWTPLLVKGAMLIGQELIFYFSIFQEYAVLVLAVVIVLAVLVLKVVIPLLTFRGRRLLYGKLQRTIRWEFWSPFILYTPIVLYTFYLWIKFRKLTVVTAANPGIEEGGFIGESKFEILNKIQLNRYVAKYLEIDAEREPEDLLLGIISFMEFNNLNFPVILKPDKGERGKGVQIIKDKKSLKNSLARVSENHIIQEYIEGKEFGIFYYRYPHQENGEIFSITKKEKIYVIGDGKHTLEQLILLDERAVCLAEIHFDTHIDNLYSIPDKGEKIQLVDLGTHSRGSLFLDGSELITNELTKKIDEISKSFDGFYFGRYDIKVASERDLKSATNIKVIEVNGVTSESTNIYDPKNSFWAAIKTLMKQWKIAFEIGAINHQNGTPIPSLKDMMKLIFNR